MPTISEEGREGEVGNQEVVVGETEDVRSLVEGTSAGEEQPAQPAAANGWAIMKTLVTRMLVIYFISSLVRNWRGETPKKGSGAPGESGAGTDQTVPPSRNMFIKDTLMDLYVYLSESGETFTDFNNSDALMWHHPGLIYGDWSMGSSQDGSFTFDTQIPCTEHLQNNGSLWIHVFITKAGRNPDPKSKDYSKRGTVYHSRRLNKYRKKRYQKTANLLTGKTDASEEDVKKVEEGVKHEILNHWHPNLTINLVYDQTNWQKGSLPPPLDEAVRFDPVTGNYYPIFFFNDYWNLVQDFQLINDTVTSLNFSVTYAPMSLFKWQLYASQQMRNKWTHILGTDMFEDQDEDQDSLKQAILDTNPYLLGLTIAVSLLHTVFEFLAFKNDIQFWRSRKSLEGLSVRSVLFNCFTSLIVLLYVMDNETNFVVKCSIGVGLLIEMWKIPKCMDVTLDRENKWLGFIPRIRIQDKGTYVQSSTRDYDILAFKYLSWALFPLLGGYAVYSVIYNEHRGWYSFVLSMLYGFLLTFGFIMMTPQLFINYKLKSVAHLPWRMLSYKFLNTFIDDIFAFVIKMPMMYRIGCFRDDIVFLVYVYQRWIYRVDPKRVNEFGTTGEDHGAARDPLSIQPTPPGPSAQEQSPKQNGDAPLSPSKKSKKEKKESKKTK